MSNLKDVPVKNYDLLASSQTNIKLYFFPSWLLHHIWHSSEMSSLILNMQNASHFWNLWLDVGETQCQIYWRERRGRIPEVWKLWACYPVFSSFVKWQMSSVIVLILHVIQTVKTACHAVYRLSWSKTAHIILFWEFSHLRVLDISTSDYGASLAYFTSKMRQEWFHHMALWQYRQVLGLGVMLLLLAHHHCYSLIHSFICSFIHFSKLGAGIAALVPLSSLCCFGAWSSFILVGEWHVRACV